MRGPRTVTSITRGRGAVSTLHGARRREARRVPRRRRGAAPRSPCSRRWACSPRARSRRRRGRAGRHRRRAAHRHRQRPAGRRHHPRARHLRHHAEPPLRHARHRDAADRRARRDRSAAPSSSPRRLEGFKVSAPYWNFENLDVEGICADDDDCEHAFHVFGDAEWTVIRRNVAARLQRADQEQRRRHAVRLPRRRADRGQRALRHARARQTGNPVTKLDIVGGRRWVMRANYIHDYEKAGGDGISYGAFLKGNSRAGHLRAQPGALPHAGEHHRRRHPHRPVVRRRRQRPAVDLRGRHLHAGAPGRRDAQQHHRSRCSDVGIYLNAAASTRHLRQHPLQHHGHRRALRGELGRPARQPALGADPQPRRRHQHAKAANLDDGRPRAVGAPGSPTPRPRTSRSLDGERDRQPGRSPSRAGDRRLLRQRCAPAARPDLGAVEYGVAALCVTATAGGGTETLPRGLRARRLGAWSGGAP